MDTSNHQIKDLLKMDWYLDTSLFLDFIKRNIKDANKNSEEFDGKTLLKITDKGGKISKGIRHFVPIIKDKKRIQFELTNNISVLRNNVICNGTNYYYSDLVKAEVFRHIRKENPNYKKEEVITWWNDFCFLIGSLTEIEEYSINNNELSKLALDFPIKKNSQDYLHIVLAKENQQAFITSDKLDGQLRTLKQSYYSHIYYWPDTIHRIPLIINGVDLGIDKNHLR